MTWKTKNRIIDKGVPAFIQSNKKTKNKVNIQSKILYELSSELFMMHLLTSNTHNECWNTKYLVWEIQYFMILRDNIYYFSPFNCYHRTNLLVRKSTLYNIHNSIEIKEDWQSFFRLAMENKHVQHGFWLIAQCHRVLLMQSDF